MAKKRVTRKKLLKEPDEFLTFTEKALQFARGHQRQLTYAGVALGIVLFGIFGVQAYLRHVNAKGQAAYNSGYYALAENLKPEGKPAEWKQAGESFQKVIDDYSMSKVAPLASAQLGFLDFLNKDYDKAILSYEKFLKESPADSPYRPLASLAIASCYEAKGDVKKTIEILSPMEKDPRDAFKEPILLSLARSYRLDSQIDKSKEVLKTFVDTYSTSPYLPLAKARLQE